MTIVPAAAARATAILCAISYLLAPNAAYAGKVLDYLRDTDLNDFALGVALSTSENPYPDSGNSTILYPYLTSFRHSAFTDDWLLIRDGNLGLRFVVDEDWELGFVGRVQTLGQGVAGTGDLVGVSGKDWTLELGPLVGFRRWPVQFQFRSYFEAPNRHDGTISEFEMSWPRQYERGFFVPAVRLSYLSAGYTDYYFGVDAQEAAEGRAEYRPGDALNSWVGATVGYEITPRWLLRSTIGIEFLDSSIESSPIVDRDQLWSGSVALAYNAKLFNPRDHPDTQGQKPLQIRVGVLGSSASTMVSRDANDGTAREDIDLEQALGVPDGRTILQLDTRLRLGYYHQLHLGYFELSRESTKAPLQDFTFGDQSFPAGEDVDIDIDSSLFRASYMYSLLRDGQKEVGISAGISVFSFDTLLRPVGSDQGQRLGSASPLPSLGAFLSVLVTDNWEVSADASVFAVDFDRYEGAMSYIRVGVERRFGDLFSAGLGYDYLYLGLQGKDADLAGELDLVYHGPKLFLGLAF